MEEALNFAGEAFITLGKGVAFLLLLALLGVVYLAAMKKSDDIQQNMKARRAKS